jgi:predicted secreted protein
VENVNLHVHESYTVALPSLGSAGYRWSSTVDNPLVVQVEQLATTRGLAQFALTALSPGETIVHFVQARSFEPAKRPESTRDFLVRVTS